MHIPEFLRGHLASGQRQTLEPLACVLSRLGDPQRRVCGVLVAGTNGKGSTCLFVQSILRAAGISSGLFLSPSLQDLRELVQLDGLPLPSSHFRSLCLEVVEAAGSTRLTLFELATAVAFVAFARAQVAVAVVEVGMGGRQDATRLLDPELSVVTSLALDHLAELGGSIEQLAWHKVGVASPGRPLLLGAKGPGLEALRRAAVAEGLEGELEVLGQSFGLEPLGGIPQEQGRRRLARGDEGAILYWDRTVRQTIEPVRMGPKGLYQLENAALALRVVRILVEQGKLPKTCVEGVVLRAALEAPGQPGRLERLALAPALRVWLDGAHNLEGMQGLLESLAVLEPDARLHVVLAVYADKDVVGMVEQLLPQVDRLILTVTEAPRCLTLEAFLPLVEAVALRTGWQGVLLGAESVAESLTMLRRGLESEAGVGCVGVVCGTLSLVAPVYRAVGRPPLPAWMENPVSTETNSGKESAAAAAGDSAGLRARSGDVEG